MDTPDTPPTQYRARNPATPQPVARCLPALPARPLGIPPPLHHALPRGTYRSDFIPDSRGHLAAKQDVDVYDVLAVTPP